MNDRTSVKINMNKMSSVQSSDRAGVSIMPLFQDERETVQMETWAPDSNIQMDIPEGAEFLVLEGSFQEGNDLLNKHDWLRIPIGGKFNAIAGKNGVKVWIKTRHLRFAQPPQ